MDIFLTTTGVCIVVCLIMGGILKYMLNKSLERLDTIPLLESRIKSLEKESDARRTDWKTLEMELRNTSERLIKVETLLQNLIDTIKNKNI